MTSTKLTRIARAHTETAAETQADIFRIKKLLTICMVVVLIIALVAFPAFADESNAIEDGVRQGLGQVYDIMTAIVIPIAVIAVGFSVFQIFTGGEKGMQKAKTTILYTIGGICILYLAPVAVQQISNWITPDRSVFGG